ncbi:hypothetical protein [Fusobacterium varium]|uniref:hypothetical protein n=1 Tax=Fusobacterium varium TaxID=856 RepID=UPI0027DBBA28|nr:hypothetical protein [uncultured Fusobacterium sp.]
MKNILFIRVTPKTGSVLNISQGNPKIGLEVIKNNSKNYLLNIDELFFKILNPHNTPNNKLSGNISLISGSRICNFFYEITYEKHPDITSLALFVEI